MTGHVHTQAFEPTASWSQIRIQRRVRPSDSRHPRANDAADQKRKVKVAIGVLSLVDLAGSERVKKSGVAGERFREATNVNGSLLTLGSVMKALAHPDCKHVPFRDSKLTYLLQDSLGGNCKTCLIVCVSPSESDASETIGALEFGDRAHKVKLRARVNTAEVDAVDDDDLLDASTRADDDGLRSRLMELELQLQSSSEERSKHARKLEQQIRDANTARARGREACHGLINKLQDTNSALRSLRTVVAGSLTNLATLCSTEFGELARLIKRDSICQRQREAEITAALEQRRFEELEVPFLSASSSSQPDRLC